jgi:hypothetical protein
MPMRTPILNTRDCSKSAIHWLTPRHVVSLGVFNSALMNDAVFKFKRYEDSSLSYTGINKHEGEDIGLYDTVLTSKDVQSVFVNVATGA